MMSYHSQAFGSLCQRGKIGFFFLKRLTCEEFGKEMETGYSTGNYMSAKLQKNVGTSFTR